MTSEPRTDHDALARALDDRIIDGIGASDRALRRAAADRAAGGPAMAEPYDTLARLIGDASYRVTDAQVAGVLAAAASEKAAFEIVLAAAAGAALLRWRQAVKAMEGTADAPQGNRSRR